MSLKERLKDPNERFSPQEIYQLFELLAEEYGFYRSQQLPPKQLLVETASLVVAGFERLGVIIVRPRTIEDSMITIPNLIDKILGNNFQPSQSSAFNAQLVALAQTVIVSPPGLATEILKSSDDRDLDFFLTFAKEYKIWLDARAEAFAKKKPGMTNGTESNSSLETDGTSSQLTNVG